MATTTNFGWETPDDTDLVKDGAAAMRTLGNSIDTSMADLKGGTTGQILSKASATDMDFVWITNDQGDITGVTAGTGISGGGTSGTVTITNSMATAIDAKGDLIAGTGADTFDRLAIGTNGQILTADSTAATGMKWASPAASGALTLITSQSFTSVSSQSINNCFTSTYTNYRIILQLDSPSTTSYVYSRLRASGSDNTSAVYNSSAMYSYNGSGAVTVENVGNGTAWIQTYNESTARQNMTITDLYFPQATQYTIYTSNSHRIANQSNGTVLTYVAGGAFNNTTSFDGFTFYAASGTFSGKVWVYGYSN